MARRIRHLPLSVWLRHPGLACTATLLARSDAHDHAELWQEAKALARASDIVGKRGRHIGRLCERAQAAASRAAHDCGIALAVDDRPMVLGGRRASGHATAELGWSVTGRTARAALVETTREIRAEQRAGIGVHHHSRSAWVTVVAYLLLLVDALALFTVFGTLLNIDWVDPAPVDVLTATAFAVFGAGVQAKLAVELGKRVWAWRIASAHRPPDDVEPHDQATEFPSRSGVVATSGSMLVLVSVCAALSIFLRVRAEGAAVDQPAVASAIGLVLAGCAIAAPWILVQQEAYDGSPLTRRAGALTRVVDRTDRALFRAIRRTDRGISLARKLDGRARRAYSEVELRIGQCYARRQGPILLARDLAGVTVPNPRSDSTPPRAALPIRLPVDLGYLTTALDQSDAAIEEAQAARARLTTRLSPPAERIDPELYLN